jgi:hypothetical protein
MVPWGYTSLFTDQNFLALPGKMGGACGIRGRKCPLKIIEKVTWRE